MNWFKFLKISRYTSIILFAIIYLGGKFGWLPNYYFTENISLYDFKTLLVFAYFFFYLKESRIEVSEKNREIKALKEQLEKN